jgi:hypothetical protein
MNSRWLKPHLLLISCLSGWFHYVLHCPNQNPMLPLSLFCTPLNCPTVNDQILLMSLPWPLITVSCSLSSAATFFQKLITSYKVSWFPCSCQNVPPKANWLFHNSFLDSHYSSPWLGLSICLLNRLCGHLRSSAGTMEVRLLWKQESYPEFHAPKHSSPWENLGSTHLWGKKYAGPVQRWAGSLDKVFWGWMQYSCATRPWQMDDNGLRKDTGRQRNS